MVLRLLFRFIQHSLATMYRLFKQMVTLTIFLLVPFQSGAYLRFYLGILQNVEHSSPNSILWRRRLDLIGLLLRLESLHLLALFLFPSQSKFDTFLHFDILEYMIPNIGLNGVDVLFLNLVAFYNEQLFFHVQQQLMDRLVAVLNHQSSDWFLSPRYKSKRICPLLIRLYATIFNLQSTYQLFFEMVITWFESWLLCTALPPLTVFTLFSHCLSALGFLLFASNLFFIISLAFSTLFTALGMFHIKMHQIYRKLAILLKQRPLSHRKVSHLQETFLSTFLFFLRINAMYRWIFASFLLAAVPLNAIITIRILLSRIPPENVPVAFFVLYYTFLFIFIFHLAFAYPSRAIHRFGSLFQHTLVCTYPKLGKTRSRIRLSHLIAAFHVPARDRYGFNYGNWGLVSLEAFLKYLLIYAKLAMTLYKLLN